MDNSDASPIQVTVIYYSCYFFICKCFDMVRQNMSKFDIKTFYFFPHKLSKSILYNLVNKTNLSLGGTITPVKYL